MNSFTFISTIRLRYQYYVKIRLEKNIFYFMMKYCNIKNQYKIKNKNRKSNFHHFIYAFLSIPGTQYESPIAKIRIKIDLRSKVLVHLLIN